MIAKEKAVELFNKWRFNPKESALIVVNEIIDFINDLEDDSIRDPRIPDGQYKDWIHACDYWIEVREELEKL